MKSTDRCKEHFQGGRCNKYRNHHLSVSAEPDALHVANFSAWKGEGEGKTLVARFEKKTPRRSRIANRMYRELVVDPPPYNTDIGIRKVMKFQLEQLAKHFGGAR